MARQVQRATRTYASDAHAHHKPAEVNESFGVMNRALARNCLLSCPAFGDSDEAAYDGIMFNLTD
jgi:hypothetical protein